MFEERVARLVKVPLTGNQHAVLVSSDFNTGSLGKSTLLKKLDKGDHDAVPAEQMKWVKGLVNRRAAEAGLWAKGEFVSRRMAHDQSPTHSRGKAMRRHIPRSMPL
ncbi:hypothetical protein ASD02_17270 [Ensifer sp. Root1252]|uniref:lysozyme n=1 Tax=Ensifer TaxID=106591 RepID=UPI00070FCD7D|nr:lysozyme [Ensifer sp. Root31]KQU96006.1 hypothetical protein ASD00_19835 [Ensifer sp. Root31]KQW34954.1 hypothetical protein ASD02_17270 [Ensifer sp. Root1252]KRC57278.1 hypothetical protein ASE32_20585 [Ensifer sp. Root231]KRC87773.1 hypothetical protein ASE47_14740 [Ensifer sp. Root258]